MSADDRHLPAEHAVTGDADCFADLIVRHRDMVYSAARRLLPEPADAEDATQEAFMRLARNAARVRTSVGAWLHRTAVNAAVDALRKDRSRRGREREATAMVAGERPEASWDDLKAEVDRAIDSLPEALRQPVVLCYLEGKTQTAVAEELGVSQATVSARVRKGVEELRQHLKRAGIAVSAVALVGFLTEHAVQAAPAPVSAELAKLALAGIKPSAPAGFLAALAATLTGSLAAKVICGVLAACVVGLTMHQVTRQPADTPARSRPSLDRGSPGVRSQPSTDRARSRAARPDGQRAAAGPDERPGRWPDDWRRIEAYWVVIGLDLEMDDATLRELGVTFAEVRARREIAANERDRSGDMETFGRTMARLRSQVEAAMYEKLTKEQYDRALLHAQKRLAGEPPPG